MPEIDQQKLRTVNFVSEHTYTGTEPGIAKIIEERYARIGELQAIASRGVNIEAIARSQFFKPEELRQHFVNIKEDNKAQSRDALNKRAETSWQIDSRTRNQR